MKGIKHKGQWEARNNLGMPKNTHERELRLHPGLGVRFILELSISPLGVPLDKLARSTAAQPRRLAQR